ncbi:hypothetical protein V6Z12_A06G076400 [Gossypium hirsutum]
MKFGRLLFLWQFEDLKTVYSLELDIAICQHLKNVQVTRGLRIKQRTGVRMCFLA